LKYSTSERFLKEKSHIKSIVSFRTNSNLSDTELSKVVKFSRETGLLNLFKNKTIKNIVDYTIGVEVGLNSNGRKNRGGTTMENIVEVFVSNVCARFKFNYIKDATSKKVLENRGIKLRVDKSSRRFDFALFNGINLYLTEPLAKVIKRGKTLRK